MKFKPDLFQKSGKSDLLLSRGLRFGDKIHINWFCI